MKMFILNSNLLHFTSLLIHCMLLHSGMNAYTNRHNGNLIICATPHKSWCANFQLGIRVYTICIYHDDANTFSILRLWSTLEWILLYNICGKIRFRNLRIKYSVYTYISVGCMYKCTYNRKRDTLKYWNLFLSTRCTCSKDLYYASVCFVKNSVDVGFANFTIHVLKYILCYALN